MSEALRQLKNGEPDLSLSAIGESKVHRPYRNRPVDDGGFSYRHPVLPQVVVLSDALCVCLAVVACIAWQGVHDMSYGLSGALLLANIMAAGAFILFPRNVPLLDIPDVTRLSAQLRYLLPPVIFGAAVFCIVLLMLSWPVAATLRMGADWLVFVAIMLVVERTIGTYVLNTDAMAHRLVRRVAIIGSGMEATQMATRINTRMTRVFRLAGIFDDKGSNVDGTIEDLVQRAREDGIDAVIMSFSPEEGGQQHVMDELWRLRGMLADVYVVPTLMTEDCHGWPVERFGPFSLTVLQRRPLNEWDMMQKRAFDLTVGALLLFALSPVLLLVALAIKLDSRGPVLFCQPRQGFNNLYFNVFKFRSMYTDMSDRDAARQTSRTDPRVTRVGRWIRRLSIDELPQLLNVLRGEMSLVGPRPHAPQTRAGGQLLHEAMEEYVARHRVQPGITGWAQINGSRGELVTRDDLRRRVVLDLEYIRAWSIWLDIKIIFLTIKREIFSRNAF
ncbi:exopolysaccharide biosynthesis polyprenyl glycosylphosphotransferase [Komagataeibacter sp. FNDCF1]|uniref:exopolysaccharide biosynthesis polyprenyl glycosylphosphotransferase n=1 Tax=Komagataeibacter sp. FNDCF1 TaxID=2878681 RepID=UPI001E326350|nr:exopolysaccharide biosynthesis polyprenyl glycosylphosphotransferase [Komagataeibacter sp. FNDCF1]MCE2566127.1 exopolysaccharide biosynthesis polyprenyl glycosylphosphotransferase [Komagataeibacter sp. FNDCF1]